MGFSPEDSMSLASSQTSGQSLRRSVYKFQNPKDLLMSVNAVVKNRTGSVLSRGMILKSDHFETGVNPKLDIHLQGAPNFRMADLNIFGVAQPTLPGIKTILTLLQCNPQVNGDESAVWISAREEPMIFLNRKPFVIRDAKSPLKNINTYHGILTKRLEQVEERLKEDIMREQHRWNGLVLVHEESKRPV
ncbi:hypothetical protein HDU91_003541 [Kappamyces sp. JEL0680]|nr:hypothetical protein HDU91_003541 [Kappamyces sp. JEL0680]